MVNATIISLISATGLSEEQEDRINIIQHKLKFLENKLTVACIESLQPLSLAGTELSDLIQVAGGIAVSTDLQTADPDVIILMLRGFSMDQTLKEVGTLLSQPGFGDLKAVKNNRLYIADGEKYFYQPGPAIVDSLEILAEIINPKQFIFGYEGEGWMKFSV